MAVHELNDSASSLGWIAMRPDDQHTLETGLAHALRQFLDTFRAEGLARLIRAILN